MYKKILEKVALSCQSDNMFILPEARPPRSLTLGGLFRAEKLWSKPQALSDIYYLFILQGSWLCYCRGVQWTPPAFPIIIIDIEGILSQLLHSSAWTSGVFITHLKLSSTNQDLNKSRLSNESSREKDSHWETRRGRREMRRRGRERGRQKKRDLKSSTLI